MTTLGWTCHTRAAPSSDMFNLGSSYFHVALTTVRHLLTVWNLVSRSQCSVCAPRQFSDWSCTNQWSSWSSWRCSSQLWQRQTCPYCMTELWTSFIHCHNCVVFEQLTVGMMFFYYLSDYVIQPSSCHITIIDDWLPVVLSHNLPNSRAKWQNADWYLSVYL